ncbi:hypothetical protein GCM10029978_050360 [Actinoallomurus acanthiterrae]
MLSMMVVIVHLLVDRVLGQAPPLPGERRSKRVPCSGACECTVRTSGTMEFVQADFVRHPFPEGAVDSVCSVAAIHHVDFERA